MSASTIRGAFVRSIVVLLAVAAACSDSTGLKSSSSSCNAAHPQSLNVGDVRPSLTGGCVYISGGASTAEYALVAFNSDTSYARTASLTFTSTGASTITTPLQARAHGTEPTLRLGQPVADFEPQLRASERRVLTPLMPAARRWYGSSRSVSSAPWVVGDTVLLNTNTGSTLAAACSTAVMRAGRVVAITNTAIVVADTGNPAGGYTDAEYLTIGTQFDTVFAMDTTAFGAPSDIDANGRIILFFTRAVNELSQPATGSLTGGFFYGRDLFPRQDSPQLGAGSGCPTSNVAEMMYLLVPDPNGVINGNILSKTYVSHMTVVTTAHELQHLINAARRLYVNTAATDFEVVWLNEGLSHIAEELLFYHQSAGLTPRSNLDSLTFIGNVQNIDAYNNDQQANFGRFETYLQSPSTSAPYAPDGNLWTRGATWSFLRYAADHRGTSDADTWRKLVNSTTSGIANLQNVFGSGLSNMFRDWAVATISDDVSGTLNEWQDPSWNFRSIFDFLASTKSYPLATVTVGDGSPLSVSLNGGGVAYVRFTAAAGQLANVNWTTSSNGVAVTLVRLK